MEKIKKAVLRGRTRKIEAMVQEALDDGAEPMEIISAMIEAMDEIGGMFQRDEIFLPEMMASAQTMKDGAAIVKPYLMDENTVSKGKFIIGTVQGDKHDIGKNLVAMMVESAGFEVIDLGADVSPEMFVKALKDNPDCKLVGLSALLTTTMEAMRATVDAIRDAGLRDRVKIMVGGAPVNEEYAAMIGADAYTPDAAAAAVKAKEFVRQ
ncbi:MAG: cobalamin-dependent protein [Oscillospiraceae bacterium]|nr:cobalamin-dependent protein [Oscillospiraceae bacterium]